jgi:hypothetical protein
MVSMMMMMMMMILVKSSDCLSQGLRMARKNERARKQSWAEHA